MLGAKVKGRRGCTYRRPSTGRHQCQAQQVLPSSQAPLFTMRSLKPCSSWIYPRVRHTITGFFPRSLLWARLWRAHKVAPYRNTDVAPRSPQGPIRTDRTSHQPTSLQRDQHIPSRHPSLRDITNSTLQNLTAEISPQVEPMSVRTPPPVGSFGSNLLPRRPGDCVGMQHNPGHVEVTCIRCVRRRVESVHG